MSFLTYIGFALVTFVAVALRSFQQINVLHRHYKLMPIGSLGMAATDVFIVTTIVHSGWAMVLPAAVGGSLGAISCTWFMHKWEQGKLPKLSQLRGNT